MIWSTEVWSTREDDTFYQVRIWWNITAKYLTSYSPNVGDAGDSTGGGYLYYEDGIIKVLKYQVTKDSNHFNRMIYKALHDTLEQAQEIAEEHYKQSQQVTQVENLVKELKHEVSA